MHSWDVELVKDQCCYEWEVGPHDYWEMLWLVFCKFNATKFSLKILECYVANLLI